MSVMVAGAVAVAGVGAYSAYNANKQQKSMMEQADKPADIEGDIRRYVAGYSKALPKVLSMEGQYRPQFQNLNLADIQSFLQGGGGQMGLLALNKKMNKGAGDQLSTARKRDIRNMNRQTGITRNLLQNMSPESANMVRLSVNDAMAAQKAAKGLTGQEKRSAQQFAREAGADRGRLMDTSTIAAEVLNRDSILGQKRQEAYQATQNAFGMANQFYSQPGLQALSSMPNSYSAGNQLLGLGMSSVGSATPQLINPDAGVNMGAAQKQNQLAAAGASAQMKSANNAAMMSTMGNMFGSYMQYRGATT